MTPLMQFQQLIEEEKRKNTDEMFALKLNDTLGLEHSRLKGIRLGLERALALYKDALAKDLEGDR